MVKGILYLQHVQCLSAPEPCSAHQHPQCHMAPHPMLQFPLHLTIWRPLNNSRGLHVKQFSCCHHMHSSEQELHLELPKCMKNHLQQKTMPKFIYNRSLRNVFPNTMHVIEQHHFDESNHSLSCFDQDWSTNLIGEVWRKYKLVHSITQHHRANIQGRFFLWIY